MIHALEFDCQAPLRFYEHCAACPRFNDDCPDLALGLAILRGKKKLVYDRSVLSLDSVDPGRFNCLAPLKYFEKSRNNCAHKGRCREEGLLLALLNGKKELVYSQKSVVEFPRLKHHHVQSAVAKDMAQEAATS